MELTTKQHTDAAFEIGTETRKALAALTASDFQNRVFPICQQGTQGFFALQTAINARLCRRSRTKKA